METNVCQPRLLPACPQGLLSAHERQEASAADLRQKVRALRQELEAREKALELARRTVERLTGEKGQLEAGAAGALAGWLATFFDNWPALPGAGCIPPSGQLLLLLLYGVL